MSKATDRKLLLVKGNDLSSVMKGTTTSNYEAFKGEQNKVLQHTLFLNSKGKIITDAVLVKPLTAVKGEVKGRENEVWIEAHETLADELQAHLKRHAFRKHLSVEDISGLIDTLLLYVGSQLSLRIQMYRSRIEA